MSRYMDRIPAPQTSMMATEQLAHKFSVSSTVYKDGSLVNCTLFCICRDSIHVQVHGSNPGPPDLNDGLWTYVHTFLHLPGFDPCPGTWIESWPPRPQWWPALSCSWWQSSRLMPHLAKLYLLNALRTTGLSVSSSVTRLPLNQLIIELHQKLETESRCRMKKYTTLLLSKYVYSLSKS